MGWGDEIQAAGLAGALHRRSGKRVKILDKRGEPRWHEIWEGNPVIARPAEQGEFATLVSGPGARPYIDIEHSSKRRWAWRSCTSEPAVLPCVKPDPRGAKRIFIEPNLKLGASPNKRWGGWQELITLARAHGIKFAQMCAPGQFSLPGTVRIETRGFLEACGVLGTARALVTHEGGLHHAAAALGVRAVVIYGEYISPAQTGYALHRNLASAPQPCGWRVPCRTCATAMASITPALVLTNLEELLVSRETEIAA